MRRLRATGSRIIVSMTDLNRAESITVHAPGVGPTRIDPSQVDAATGLYLGADRYPHQGVIIARGPRCPDELLKLGTTVMLVADLGNRWGHEGMTVQSVTTLAECNCSAGHSSGSVVAILGPDGPKAPRDRVICEQIGKRTARVIDVGPMVEGVQVGDHVLHTEEGGARWTAGGVDYVSLRIPRGCRCGVVPSGTVLAAAPPSAPDGRSPLDDPEGDEAHKRALVGAMDPATAPNGPPVF